MAKGYVLVNEIPNSCIGCMFWDMGFCQALHEGEEYIPDEDVDRKPNWCPIHKFPNRQQPERFTISPVIKEQYSFYNQGYNDCLDIIKGEKK